MADDIHNQINWDLVNSATQEYLLSVEESYRKASDPELRRAYLAGYITGNNIATDIALKCMRDIREAIEKA